MSKKSALCFVILSVFFLSSFGVVSAAQSTTATAINSSYTAVYINNPDNIFSYEVGFRITNGSTNDVVFNGFFLGATTTSGSALDDGGTTLSVYESTLGNDAVGRGDGNGTYNIFNVSHTGELRLNTNLYIANTKGEDSPAICGNDVVETGEDCDGSDLNGGTCVSEGYVSGTLSCSGSCGYVTSVCLTSSGTPGTSGGGGGGGTVTPAVNVSSIKISAIPGDLVVSVVVGKEEKREVYIKNLGTSKVVLQLKTSGLNPESALDKTSITLESGKQEKVYLTLKNLRKGVYAGKIIVEYNGQVVKEVPLIVNMKSDDFLFDSKVSLPKGKYSLVGEDLVAQVNLKEVAVQKEPVDVTVNYVIKGFDGSTYLDESETFAVQGSVTYAKNFSTAGLPIGKYVLGIEVVYPGAFATSSVQFSVVTERPSPIPLTLIAVGVMTVILVGVIVWAGKRKALNRFRRHK